MNSKPTQVLIMDENPHQAELLVNILEDSSDKFVVVEIKDFYKAFEKIGEDHFDVLLISLGLNKQRNLNFLSKVNAQFPKIAVLIILDDFDAELALKAFEYGAQDYLIKGEFQGKALERLIFKAIQKKELQLKLRREAEKLVDKDISTTQTSEDFAGILHELQVHRIELEMQNEELRKVGMELEESKEKYRDLYDFAPIGYLSLDEKGIIINANLTGAALLNTEKKNLIDKAFILFLDQESRRKFHKHLNDALKTGTLQICQLKILKKGIGEESFDAQIETVPVYHDEGNFKEFRTVLKDVTDQKNAELSIARLAALVKSSDDCHSGDGSGWECFKLEFRRL